MSSSYSKVSWVPHVKVFKRRMIKIWMLLNTFMLDIYYIVEGWRHEDNNEFMNVVEYIHIYILYSRGVDIWM